MLRLVCGGWLKCAGRTAGPAAACRAGRRGLAGPGRRPRPSRALCAVCCLWLALPLVWRERDGALGLRGCGGGRGGWPGWGRRGLAGPGRRPRPSRALCAVCCLWLALPLVWRERDGALGLRACGLASVPG
jgi:hypothetical protein